MSRSHDPRHARLMVWLDDWAVVSDESPYVAPEMAKIKIVGRRRSDGQKIATSFVESSDGLSFKTASGSTYYLGKVDPKYAAWCRKNDRAIDPKHPLRIFKKRK